PPVGLVGAFVARVRHVPFVLGCQDITPEAPIITGDLSNPALIRVLAASARRIFRSAAAVVSIGRDMNRRLEHLGVPADKIHLIPNWFDGSLVAPLTGPSSFRSEHGWDDRFVVMHSGNIGLGQDLNTLIDAAALLADSGGNK